MSLFRNFERTIDEKLRKLFGSQTTPGQGRELVEIQRLILDRVDDRVQQLPRARRVFPYDFVAVRLPVPDAELRAAYETVFVADEALREEIADHLRRDDVEFPRDLQVEVTLFDSAEVTEPSLVFRKREEGPVAVPSLGRCGLYFRRARRWRWRSRGSMWAGVRKCWTTVGGWCGGTTWWWSMTPYPALTRTSSGRGPNFVCSMTEVRTGRA